MTLLTPPPPATPSTAGHTCCMARVDHSGFSALEPRRLVSRRGVKGGERHARRPSAASFVVPHPRDSREVKRQATRQRSVPGRVTQACPCALAAAQSGAREGNEAVGIESPTHWTVPESCTATPGKEEGNVCGEQRHSGLLG